MCGPPNSRLKGSATPAACFHLACGQYTEYASLTGARYRLSRTFPICPVGAATGYDHQVGIEEAAFFHDLRHTGGTMTAIAGATTKELMARLSHSRTRAAMIYQHATRDRDKSIAAGLGKLLDAARDNK